MPEPAAVAIEVGRFWRLPLSGASAHRRRHATDPACTLAPAHCIVEAALLEANSGPAVSQPASAASFSRLQQQTTTLWS